MSSKVCIFDKTIFASLLQPLCHSGMDFKSYFTRINMKLIEQRNEISGEKELKFEISKSDDFEFLFAETLNNEKYQILARDHDLIVDFDTFPKVFINNLLSESVFQDNERTTSENKKGSRIFDSKPTEITIKLDNDKQFCMFEVFSKTPVSKGRIFSIKLLAVRGDQLITHLLKILSDNQMKRAALETANEELSTLKLTLSEALENNRKLVLLEKNASDLTERNKDLENELELVKEERETIRVLAEEKDEEIEDLKAVNANYSSELEEAKEELSIVGIMLKEEQSKVDQLQKAVECYRKEARRLQSDKDSLSRKVESVSQLLKLRDEQNCEQSIDIRKLKELEADLQQKDLIIISLTEAQSSSKKDLDNERLKLKESQESNQTLKLENDFLKKKLNYRRSENLSVPLTPSGIGTAARNTYRSVLPHASPMSGTPDSKMKDVFQNSSLWQHSTTPSDIRKGNLQNFNS